MHSQPPSTGRLMPFIARFSSRKRDAFTTSAIVTRRPVGVRSTRASKRSGGMSRHCGLSPTIAGCSAFTRVGASSITSVRTRPVTPPFTVVTVVDPWNERMDDLRVPDELQRDQAHGRGDVVFANGVRVAIDRSQHEVLHG